MKHILRCYVEGSGRQWEALCLDLDIAVQGESFEAVVASLRESIGLYLEHVMSLPESEQRRFWRRRAPLSMRLRFLWNVIRASVRDDGRDGKQRAEILIPCPA